MKKLIRIFAVLIAITAIILVLYQIPTTKSFIYGKISKTKTFVSEIIPSAKTFAKATYQNIPVAIKEFKAKDSGGKVSTLAFPALGFILIIVFFIGIMIFKKNQKRKAEEREEEREAKEKLQKLYDRPFAYLNEK